MKIEEIKALAKRFQGYADASNVAGFITPEVDEVASILPGLIRDAEELRSIRDRKEGFAEYQPARGLFLASIFGGGKIICVFKCPPTLEQGRAMAAALDTLEGDQP